MVYRSLCGGLHLLKAARKLQGYQSSICESREREVLYCSYQHMQTLRGLKTKEFKVLTLHGEQCTRSVHLCLTVLQVKFYIRVSSAKTLI